MNNLIKYENGIYSSINDNNKYNKLILPNGLKIFLIEDKTTKISSAVMYVDVGSKDNPKNFEGIAHFLEHMLFMGSKKYQGGAFFQNEVAKYGGSTNAFTTDNCTQYYFNANDNFMNLLDIFGRFFIDPLFDIKYIEREINAVDSEHKKNIGNDTWRFMEIVKNIFIDGNNNRFTTGTKQLLLSSAKNNYENLRNIMINFYNEYYTASKMTLFLSHHTIDDDFINQLTNLFSQVSEHKNIRKHEIVPTIRKNNNEMIELIKMKTTEESTHLTLLWLLCGSTYCDKNNMTIDSYEILSYVLNNKNENSLYALLDRQKYIIDMYSSVDKVFDNHCLYSIRLKLTEKGYQHWLIIVYCIDLYIKNLAHNDIFDRFNKEIQIMHTMNLKIFDKIDSLSLCQYYAEIYDNKKHCDISFLPISFVLNDTQKCKKHLTDCLKQMTINNVKVIITSNLFNELKLTDKYYGTKYDIQNVNIIKFNKLFNDSHLIPSINKYITNVSNLKIINIDNYVNKQYRKIDSKFNNCFYVKTNIFKTYSNYGIIKIETNDNNVDSWMMTLIYFKYINRIKSGEKQLLRNAKLNVEIIPHHKGFTIIINGYNSIYGIHNIFDKVFDWYFGYHIIDIETYNMIYDEIMTNLCDYKYVDPYEMIVPELKCIVDKNNHYSNNDMINSLQKLKNVQISELSFCGTITGVFGGSIELSSIVKIIETLENKFKMVNVIKKDYDIPKSINILKTNENPNNSERACCYGIFIGSIREYATNDKWVKNIFCDLLESYISEKFSAYIRTEKQLGYIARALIININGSRDPYSYLLFITQSTDNNILSIVSDYVENHMMTDILSIDDEMYNDLKNGLINNLMEKPRNIQCDCDEFVECIMTTYDIDNLSDYYLDRRFNRNQIICDFLNKTTKLDFFTFINMIHKNNKLMLQIIPL